jgi:hypothetical protein
MNPSLPRFALRSRCDSAGTTWFNRKSTRIDAKPTGAQAPGFRISPNGGLWNRFFITVRLASASRLLAFSGGSLLHGFGFVRCLLGGIVGALAVAPVASMPAREAEIALTPKWEPVAPGVWKATIGLAEDLTLLGAAGQAPRLDALAAMPAAAFPLAEWDIEARVETG